MGVIYFPFKVSLFIKQRELQSEKYTMAGWLGRLCQSFWLDLPGSGRAGRESCFGEVVKFSGFLHFMCLANLTKNGEVIFCEFLENFWFSAFSKKSRRLSKLGAESVISPFALPGGGVLTGHHGGDATTSITTRRGRGFAIWAMVSHATAFWLRENRGAGGLWSGTFCGNGRLLIEGCLW